MPWIWILSVRLVEVLSELAEEFGFVLEFVQELTYRGVQNAVARSLGPCSAPRLVDKTLWLRAQFASCMSDVMFFESLEVLQSWPKTRDQTILVKYDELGYSRMEEYLQDFQQSLLRTTHTYDYFVDWRKVEQNAKEHIVEFGLLNSITLISNTDERRELLRRLLREHPKLLTAVPILLAVRESELEVAELTDQIIYRQFDFSQASRDQVDKMVVFCEKIGILELLGKVKDVYSYVLGAEVGLDSNARKNRSGDVFKKMVDNLLTITEQELSKEGVRIYHKAEVKLTNLGISQSEKKQVDFMVYESGRPVAACEVNVYNTQGSKPTEIIRSYTHLNDLLKPKGIKFLWYTDGPGWNLMWNAFKEGARNVDYVMNYTIGMRRTKGLLQS